MIEKKIKKTAQVKEKLKQSLRVGKKAPPVEELANGTAKHKRAVVL